MGRSKRSAKQPGVRLPAPVVCDKRLGIQIVSVAETNDKGYLYTYNSRNGVEFIALDVPKDKANDVYKVMMHLSTQTVDHGHTAQGPGSMELMINELKGESKTKMLNTKAYFLLHTNPNARLFQLVSRFETEHPQDWGSFPSPPEGRLDLVADIREIWRKQRTFFLAVDLTVDGQNLCIANGKRVDLAVALRHVQDWNVDWDKDLNAEQRAFVVKHHHCFYQVAKVLFRKTFLCGRCGAMEGKLAKCARCKNVWHCVRTTCSTLSLRLVYPWTIL